MRWRKVAISVATVITPIIAVGACGSSDETPTDAGADTSVIEQTPFDAGDSTIEGDGTVDAGAEAQADADAEAQADAGAEAEADAQADAGAEAGADTGPDADAATDSDASLPPPTLTLGAPDRILLIGTVVTPDVTFDGEVLVEQSTITCAQAGTACESMAGASGATVIVTNGVIAPGLVDAHNHILFDVFDHDDWTRAQLYTNHDQWTGEARYQTMLDVKQCLEDASQGKPAWCPATYDGAGSLKCELDKYGELKAMIAGVTSVVGLPGTSSACFGSLTRSIDVSQNGLGGDTIQTSALFPPSKSSADGVCANYTSLKTAAYLIHCGEGTDAKSLGEWTKLGSVTTDAGCLYVPQTTVTHGTAFTSSEFSQMQAAGMKLTWSPASNVDLYGATADIPAALDAGVIVSLGADWSMGGSQNLLDEIRFADAWDDAHWSNRLDAKTLVTMATANGAKALALEAKIGSIAPGMAADLMVVARTKADPYASIVAATPREVTLTIIGGQLLYGDLGLVGAAPQTPGCETFDACGQSKFLCVATSSSASKLNQTYAEIKAALEAAMIDVDSVRPADGQPFAPLTPLVKCPAP